MKICPKAWNVAKVGSNFYQTLNKPTKVYQRVLTFCQNSEILPLNVIDFSLFGQVVKIRNRLEVITCAK